MKEKVIIFYGEDGAAAKIYGSKIRTDSDAAVVSLIDASIFDGVAEPANRVIIMPDVFPWRRDKIEEAYPDKVEFAKEPDEAPINWDAKEYPATNFHTEFQQAMEVKRPRGRPRKIANQ